MRSDDFTDVNPFEPPNSQGRSSTSHIIYAIAICVFLILIGIASLGIVLNGVWDLLGTIAFMGNAAETYLAPMRQRGISKVVIGATGLFGMAVGLFVLFIRINRRIKRSVPS